VRSGRFSWTSGSVRAGFGVSRGDCRSRGVAREKPVRIAHPDLPVDLGAAAGGLVATLWARAAASAQTALDALRVEAQRAVVAARNELGRTETALEQRTAALLAAQVEIRELEKAQAEGHEKWQALEAELARILAVLAARERELVEAREGFSRDLGINGTQLSARRSGSGRPKNARCSNRPRAQYRNKAAEGTGRRHPSRGPQGGRPSLCI
jgi:hypothetical protein